MGIEVFKDTDDGSTIIAARGGPENRLTGRRQLPHVIFDNLDSFAIRYSLTNRQKAWLSLRLNHLAGVFAISALVDKTSADSAVSGWIHDLEQSIGRIAAAPEAEPRKYQEALYAMDLAAQEWAKGFDDSELRNKGYEVSHHGGLASSGGYYFINQWFHSAKLIKTFAADAVKALETRNRPKGFGDWWAGPTSSIGKETRLYGVRLPRLYERLIGAKFGISKASDGSTVQKTAGVAFVIDAAAIIGRTLTASNVAAHFHKAKRAGYWKPVADAAKKGTRVTRHGSSGAI